MQPSAIVIGSGIVGLAVTRALSNKGWKVTVIERNPKPVGASIRNFGMVWPVGQAQGPTFDRAMRSRAIWMEMSKKAKFWAEETGSLHLAYTDLENQVVEEYVAAMQGIKSAFHLNPAQTAEKSKAAIVNGLKGALWTEEEMIVDPREAIWQTAAFLESLENVTFEWNKAVTEINGNKVRSGNQTWEAEQIFVCSGADFETLYPEIFDATPITKCKLQMMRLAKQPENWRIGPPLCAGLSFIHYKGFHVAPSLAKLKSIYEEQYPDLLDLGIHVMVSQNGNGQLTIGDSHEYGRHLDPFDREDINKKITDFLKTFAAFKDWTLESSWHGIYPKMTDGATEFIHQASPQVWIVNGMGGAGMTLSFGLGEEVVEKIS
ncbi:TIGR03364 family FAD-dependent oxidoreductase [Aquiflexum gelatinilyticum]|uniref:TIGR03364 family FAD-dependent oxidoreductase n=1 Tax=Aquiflexum gelatinilyticum TaxID=2961943 RepID=A0A9X2P2T7_9BACT|nr:TIGR03364 family FAD-dependent oxidoreductase [Aquiflexum gelatinilyticum]MCR9014651.1 TIGR03364 family FAD-dependent oxidoreductase [Aquiflexum gelatinilyticum]